MTPALLMAATGTLAAILTTLAFVPQVLKTLRSGSAADLSWIWLGSFASGVGLWLIYGLMLPSIPIIAANALTLAMVLILLALKVRQARTTSSSLISPPATEGPI